MRVCEGSKGQQRAEGMRARVAEGMQGRQRVCKGSGHMQGPPMGHKGLWEVSTDQL
jgi:hypothetical protein